MRDLVANNRRGSVLARQVLAQARAGRQMLVCAESCTGGLVSAALSAIPGASDVFAGGFVTYSNALKTRLLGVSETLLAAHGAVSSPVAQAMAHGAIAVSGATLGVSLTGIAGPGGGSAQKPVGLVFIGIAWRKPADTMPAGNLAPAQRLQESGRQDLSRHDLAQPANALQQSALQESMLHETPSISQAVSTPFQILTQSEAFYFDPALGRAGIRRAAVLAALSLLDTRLRAL